MSIEYSYRKKPFFLTRAEHEFFDLLIKLLGPDYYIFPQVSISAILSHKIKGQDWEAAFSHIHQKSIDYVVCNKTYIEPILAIELDDRSHLQEDRRIRDLIVESILKEAHMPLVRFENHGRFDETEIKTKLLEALIS